MKIKLSKSIEAIFLSIEIGNKTKLDIESLNWIWNWNLNCRVHIISELILQQNLATNFISMPSLKVKSVKNHVNQTLLETLNLTLSKSDSRHEKRSIWKAKHASSISPHMIWRSQIKMKSRVIQKEAWL